MSELDKIKELIAKLEYEQERLVKDLDTVQNAIAYLKAKYT